MECEDREEVGEERNGHGRAREGGKADGVDDLRQVWADARHSVGPVVNDPEEEVAEEAPELTVEL